MLSEGQLSGHPGARRLLPNLPGSARELIAGRGYDSNSFRAALIEPGIAPCIRPTGSRKVPLPYDAALYRQRHRTEVMFGRVTNCCRTAMRYGSPSRARTPDSSAACRTRG